MRDSFSPLSLSCFHLLPFSLPGKSYLIFEIGIAKESVSLANSMCFKAHSTYISYFRQLKGQCFTGIWYYFKIPKINVFGLTEIVK